MQIKISFTFAGLGWPWAAKLMCASCSWSCCCCCCEWACALGPHGPHSEPCHPSWGLLFSVLLAVPTDAVVNASGLARLWHWVGVSLVAVCRGCRCQLSQIWSSVRRHKSHTTVKFRQLQLQQQQRQQLQLQQATATAIPNYGHGGATPTAAFGCN